MIRGSVAAGLLAAAACLSALAQPAAAACRQALALGLDVSGSVDAREYGLQMQGLAAALNRPRIRTALLENAEAPVRLAVFEWSAPRHQVIVVPWTEIGAPADLDGVIARLVVATRAAGPPSTALGEAMLFGARLLAEQAGCWQRTLDISGDGKSNTGTRPTVARTDPSVAPITINGLTIGADAPRFGDSRQMEIGELSSYYRAQVIHGPGAFVETAVGFEAFEDAMARKLERELKALSLTRLGDGP